MSCLSSRIRPTHLCLSLLTALALVAPEARAALGDDVSIVAADQARLQASLSVKKMDGYTIHELTPPAGMAKLRQYVGNTGKIFAVSWSGGWRPNLRDIMGSRYDQFVAATRARVRRTVRGPMRVELPGMVVVMGSYLRTSWGHVYLVDLAPPGWSQNTVGGAP
jgi:hypothetical protein